ncbi:MAG: hypothetical protein J0G29_06115 [Alphaproteobacteria bacterium]|nr:hypothetical protein [Alphaproteobacteria bacterium]OJV46646.1 MAG: hypothetical protein BGO28_04780 [Alphaproteobacteria bacterium 43-37]
MVKRHILPLVKESLKSFPAVLINGARQVGKFTLVRQLKNENVVDQTKDRGFEVERTTKIRASKLVMLKIV